MIHFRVNWNRLSVDETPPSGYLLNSVGFVFLLRRKRREGKHSSSRTERASASNEETEPSGTDGSVSVRHNKTFLEFYQSSSRGL